MRLISGVRVTQEIEQSQGDKSAVGAAGGAPSPGSSGKNGGQNPSTLMAAAVADSAGCHRDAILALAGAQTSQKILISASRDGVIKVWK
jgi:organic hydroperoxide reductase OsmC/OhrA